MKFEHQFYLSVVILGLALNACLLSAESYSKGSTLPILGQYLNPKGATLFVTYACLYPHLAKGMPISIALHKKLSVTECNKNLSLLFGGK